MITIFTITGCPHCSKAKDMISGYGWDISEINLDSYPEKRAGNIVQKNNNQIDMLKLSARLTVPQIFFPSNVLIGGLSDLELLVAKGTLNSIYQDSLNKKISLDLLLLKPAYPPKEPRTPLPRSLNQQISIGEGFKSYVEIVEMLRNKLHISNNRYFLKTYPKSFLGKDMTNFFLEISSKSRDECIIAAQKLMDSGVFYAINSSNKFEDSSSLYRLQADSETFVLNRMRVWTDRMDNPLVTVKACKKLLNEIMSKYESGGLFDYEAVSNDPSFANFEESVCEFQKTDLVSLDKNERTAFCINLYNLMILHAFAKLGIPKTTMQRFLFFDNLKYEIGGKLFSFNDIENGILRGNRKAPFHPFNQFSASDPRAEFILPLENRVHFALNCGAKSCPPIKSFTAEALDEELSIVSESFFEDQIRIDGEIVHISQILGWYSDDFGANDHEILSSILKWCRGQNLNDLNLLLEAGKGKISHLEYDWNSNASRSKIYDLGSITSFFQ